jgi:hypothetical protein
MSRILDLASEPFNEVISYLDTLEWTALWICGDLRLNYMLGKGRAVRKMEIEWSTFSRRPWPSQVIELAGLESFSLSCVLSRFLVPLSGLQLSTLSRNLKKLKLDCASSLGVLDDFHSTHPGHFQHLQTLRLKFCSDIGTIQSDFPATLTDLGLSNTYGASCILPLSLLPPNLTRLFLKDVNFKAAGDSRFPETLKTLELEVEALFGWQILFHLVSPGIEKISVRVLQSLNTPFSEEDWNALSKLGGGGSLKFLEFPVWGPLNVDQVRRIPRSVEVLKLSQVFLNTKEWCIEMLQSGALSPKLKTLHGIWPLMPIPIDVAQNLPKTLQRVGNHAIAPESISHLPDSMVDIKVGFIGDFPNDVRCPENLQHLNLPSITLSMIKILPNGLQSLKIHTSRAEFTIEMIEILPRNLTELTAPWTQPKATNVELLFKALPSALKYLDISSYTKEGPARSKPVSAPATTHSSLSLPRGLEYLKIETLDFLESDMGEWINGLPSNLTIFRFGIKDLQIGALSFLSHLTALNQLSVTAKNFPNGGWAQFLDFGALPRKLTDLRFRTDPAVDPATTTVGRPIPHTCSGITDETLRGAPPRLRTLNLPGSPLLTQECLIHIPHVDNLWEEYKSPLWYQHARDGVPMTSVESSSIFSRILSWLGLK